MTHFLLQCEGGQGGKIPKLSFAASLGCAEGQKDRAREAKPTKRRPWAGVHDQSRLGFNTEIVTGSRTAISQYASL